ncbi:MAG: phosphoribosylamine--glycine ligase [Lachnospiraceae bacterium]|nr:phosphoribosylamine--glycine ligase [Lachnospiraceae bacterium]
MKVLIIGGGGREHAIAMAVNQSKHLTKLYCAPGNGGTGMVGENVNIGAMDFLRLADFAEKEKIDLTIVGMDDPLVGGIVDVFDERGLRIFGPNKKAAIIEGSKSFAKDLMKKYQIPTAGYETFEDSQSALEHLENCSYPVVIKADGLALGKGVLICEDQKTAMDGVKEFMMEHKFGDAGNKIVIEEFMEGREVSVLSFVDGEHIQLLSSAQDHKRACDYDQGLNTGGMGTFSPSPFYTEEVDEFCKQYVYQATVDAMKSEGRTFKGVLFFGLMLTKEGPKVLEYNARFGDPEAQVILPRMKTDILDIMNACLDGTLNQIEIEFEDNAAVCVVLASKGYPLEYEKNKLIQGLEHFENCLDLFCFHAGTALRDGQIYSNGGRVLGITALGSDLVQARANAYKAVELVQFENKYYRTDIGKAIEQTQS